ncbi:hypothetical protein HGRIS_011273 [Hohenbuehelia grisea]|uniref:CHAT domain-containing protein n=1 Tax=Hohenbuehelia grisea TaxID=104357 RepID=A0ABR3JWR5_9AGAR
MELETESLQLRPPGHPVRYSMLNHLAISLQLQYERTGAQSDLDRAVDLQTEALQLCPPGHPKRDTILIDLAGSLKHQYQRTGAQDDLDRVVELETEAMQLRPPGHQERDRILNNLSLSLTHQYRRTGAQIDLDRAVELGSEALQLRPPGHLLRNATLVNLAACLRHQYRQTRAQSDLDRAMELETEALQLFPPGHPLRSTILYNLSLSLKYQYEQTHAQNHLDRATEMANEALQLCPPGHPEFAYCSAALADLLWISDLRGPAVPTDKVFTLLKAGCMDIISPLQDSLACVRTWLKYARQIHDNAQLTDAYTALIDTLGRYLVVGPTMQHQYNSLLAEADLLSLPMDAAAHSMQVGNVARAVELLDAGRSLLWSEMRRFREPLLRADQLDNELATAFESTRSQLRELSMAEAKHGDVSSSLSSVGMPSTLASNISYNSGLLSRKRKLHEEFSRLLNLIREQPGFEDYLDHPSFARLREAARDGPVIIVNCSQHQSDVIIVFAARDPIHIPLAESFWATANRMHRHYLDARKLASGALQRFAKQLKTLLAQLWSLVVADVVQALVDADVPKGSRIWWCPTSILTILPFHAAGSGKNFLIDSYISSYTPTLKALINARRSSPPSLMQRLERRIVIAQTDDPHLPSAAKELAVMRDFEAVDECLDAQDATYDDVLRQLQSCTWVHFICHGWASPIPFDSCLRLHDKPLTLNDIIKSHLPNGQFAFLAACHTAEHDPSAPQDEVLHFAAAMQFSGFRSVVGTMWEMVDEDGPDIAKVLYEEMLADETDNDERHTRTARALWKTTQDLKDRAGARMDRWVNFVHIGA